MPTKSKRSHELLDTLMKGVKIKSKRKSTKPDLLKEEGIP